MGDRMRGSNPFSISRIDGSSSKNTNVIAPGTFQ